MIPFVFIKMPALLIRYFVLCVSGTLSVVFGGSSFHLGDFMINVTTLPLQVHASHPLNANVWSTRLGSAFVGITETLFSSIQSSECFAIHDAAIKATCSDQSVSVVGPGNNDTLWINGSLCNASVSYSARFSLVTTVELALDITFQPPTPASGARGWVTSLIYESA